MYYTIYKTTNKTNGKCYIGSHKTKDLNDNYLGSGKLLTKAIEKYGIENFQKEILFVFNNAEEMYAKEAEIVNEDFLSEENTYNLKIGGFGGWDFVNSKIDNPTHKTEHLRLMTKKRMKEFPKGTRYKKITSEKHKKKISETKRKKGLKPFLGKKHSAKTIQKMKENATGKQRGIKNSQFGTCWINDGELSKKIKVSDSIPDGWKKGRIIKK